MLTQTWALIFAAYRELNAKKLFWITMILSGVIVLCIAASGVDRGGISIFGWTLSLAFSVSASSPLSFTTSSNALRRAARCGADVPGGAI